MDNTFSLLLNDRMFKKGDILVSNGANCLITKDYKVTWWKKLLRLFGFKFKCFRKDGFWEYKVKMIQYD